MSLVFMILLVALMSILINPQSAIMCSTAWSDCLNCFECRLVGDDLDGDLDGDYKSSSIYKTI
jgi:hypothetical protein